MSTPFDHFTPQSRREFFKTSASAAAQMGLGISPALAQTVASGASES